MLQNVYSNLTTVRYTLHHLNSKASEGNLYLANKRMADRVFLFQLVLQIHIVSHYSSWNLSRTLSSKEHPKTGSIRRRVGKLANSRCLPRPSAWNNSADTGRIFMKCEMNIFRKSVERLQALLKYNGKMGSLLEDLCTFFIISRW